MSGLKLLHTCRCAIDAIKLYTGRGKEFKFAPRGPMGWNLVAFELELGFPSLLTSFLPFHIDEVLLEAQRAQTHGCLVLVLQSSCAMRYQNA
jgi:hypothetical protein